MTQSIPVQNAGLLYVNNLQVTRASGTTLSVAAGQCRDSNNILDLVISEATTLNAATNGLNGLDTGSLANSTFYYVYVIGDSTNKNETGTILSTSKTTPTLPFGYDSYRLIGVEKTDGSAALLARDVVGNGNMRVHYWDAAITASVGGSGQATSLTAIDVSAGVPPLGTTPATLLVSFTPASAGNTVGFTPFGSTATAIRKLSASVAAVAQQAPVPVLTKLDSTTPKVLYINSAASCTTAATVADFTYFI